MINNIKSAYELYPHLNHNRDPIKKIHLDKLKELFGESENLLYTLKTKNKLLPIFKPDILLTASGVNSMVGVYVRGPMEFGFSNDTNVGKNLTLKSIIEGTILQNYMKATIDKDAKILYVGYHACMEDFPNFYKTLNFDVKKEKIVELSEACYKIKSSAKLPDNEFSLLKAADYSQLPADALRVQLNRVHDTLEEIYQDLGNIVNDQVIYNFTKNVMGFINIKSKIEVSNRVLNTNDLNYRLELLKLNLYNLSQTITETPQNIQENIITPILNKNDNMNMLKELNSRKNKR